MVRNLEGSLAIVIALGMGQFAASDFSGPVITEPGTQRRKHSGHIELIKWQAQA